MQGNCYIRTNLNRSISGVAYLLTTLHLQFALLGIMRVDGEVHGTGQLQSQPAPQHKRVRKR